MRALVTGATGFVGGRLAAALSERGADVRALVRDKQSRLRISRTPASSSTRVTCSTRQPARRRRGRGHRLLPRPLDGPRRRPARASPSGSGARPRTSPGWRARRASSGSCISAGSATSAPSTCEPRRDRGGAGRARPAARVLPRRDGDRRGQRVVQDGPLPGGAAAGDDRPRLAPQPDAADRRSTTCSSTWPRPPSGPRRPASEIQIGGPDVMTYAELLDLMADVLGKRRRPKVPVPLLTPAPLLALDRPGDARGRRRGAAADREPRERRPS